MENHWYITSWSSRPVSPATAETDQNSDAIDAMAPSKHSTKKQTRLSFTPVPSSSPAAKASSSRVISHVRFDSPRRSGSQRTNGQSTPINRYDIGSDDDHNIHLQLPTPEQSSQPAVKGSDTAPQDRNIIIPSQTQVSEKSQSEGESDDDIIVSGPKSRRKQSKVEAMRHATSDHDLSIKAEDAADVAYPAETATPTRRSRRLRRPRSPPSTDPLSAKVSTMQNAELIDFGEAETSDDEITLVTTRSSKPSTRKTRMTPRSRDTFIVGDDTIELESSEDEDVVLKTSRRNSTRRPKRNVSESETLQSDDHSTTPSKRKHRGRLVRTPHKRSKQDEQDLEEDLDDLADSAVRTSRTRGATVNTARDKYRQGLQALKRSRARRSSPVQRDQTVIDIDDDDDEQEVEHVLPYSSRNFAYDDLSESSHSEEPDPDEDLDGYEEDFIVDDGEDMTNTADLLPLEFSRWATAPPRDHFRNVIEWLVKNKIAPAFDRSNQLFDLSFRKINDEVKAQAGSRYISSAWKPDFKRALEARPDLQAVRVGIDGSRNRSTFLRGDDEEETELPFYESCQACGRTGHPATWTFQFKGHAYYHDTLEPVSSSTPSSSRSSSPSSSPSQDSRSQPLLPKSHAFHLGNTCASNAIIAHKLSHWKHHLNTYILSILQSNGLLTPEAIVHRDHGSQRKREKEAETFLDALDQGGEMDELWRTWRRELGDVRRGMEDWDDGGGGTGIAGGSGGKGKRGIAMRGQGRLGIW